MATQGQGVWLGLTVIPTAWDGARSICPCDEDQVLMATATVRQRRRGDPDLLRDNDDGSRINRIRRLIRTLPPAEINLPLGARGVEAAAARVRI